MYTELSDILADIYNKAMARGEDLGLGLGKLVTLPKPGKPAGPDSSEAYPTYSPSSFVA